MLNKIKKKINYVIMIYIIILFILFNIVKAEDYPKILNSEDYPKILNPEDYPKIYGHFKNGTAIEICPMGEVECLDVAQSYTIGEGEEEFLVWTPFGEPGIAGEHVGIILAKALREIILETRDKKTNKDKIKGRIEVVSWSDTAYKEICKKDDPNSECPSVIILGTTQFAYRSKKKDIAILDSFFDQYLNDTHEPLTDSFLKQVYYDYNIDSHFMAVPLILDIRLLYFNRTTFDTLQLNYPPPYGNWGSYSKPYYNEWDWYKFVEYVNKINENFPDKDAFSFTGQYDEEMKLFHMIIRNYFIETIDENKTCGYLNNKEGVLNIIEKIIKPIFSKLGDKWYPNNEETMSFLNNKTYIEPENLPRICCRDTSEYSNGFFGITIDSPNSMRKVKLYGEDNPNGEIAAGYIPGSTSYLGGSGIAITSYTSDYLKKVAWKFILKLTNSTNGYLTDIGRATNMIPPYDSLYDIKFWNEKQWDIPKNQIRHSLQIQYPRQTFPEFGELEDRHIIRLMILEILKKGIEPSEAVDRCCKLMNSVLTGACSDEHWSYSIGDCSSFNNRKVTFNWINACKGGIPLPEDITISCSYISVRSGIGGSMVVFSVLGIMISLIYIFLFLRYKNIEPIKKAPLNFSLIVILGSILNYASVIFSTGNPDEFKCILNKWFLIIGLSLAFGGLTVKLKIVYEMHKNRELNQGYISDVKLYRILVGLIAINTIALIFWTSFNSPIVSAATNEERINSRVIKYDVTRCKNPREQNIITLFFVYIFNIIVLLYGLWLSYKTWTIPQSHTETKFVGTCIFISVLGIFIAIPLIWFSYTDEINYLIKSLILNFSTAVAVSVYCVPKIWAAYYYSSLLSKKKDSNELLVNGLSTDKITESLCCPNCGALISSNLNQFETQDTH